MMRLVSGLMGLVVVGSLLSGSTWGAAAPGQLLVGYSPDDRDAAHLAIAAAGGSVKRASPELGFAVVQTDDPARFRQVASLSPFIQYVENDDATRLAGAQWNGAQWNGAQWNGAQWNGAQWNGAQWNGAQWNGAQWNSAQWNAAKWTRDNYHARGSGWQYSIDSSDPGLVWQWGTWATDTHLAWARASGSLGTTLCVLDSGVAWDHPDLAPNVDVAASWNAMDPLGSAYDDAGHGTHVAGIAAGAVGNAFGIAGVANARIVAVKVLDANGAGHESDLAFGLVWCAQQGADVALMALQVTEADHPTLLRALDFADARDVLMVASAGNDGPCADCVAFPARDERVLAVGAVDGQLGTASFSDRGPQIDIVAPGVDVLGPFPGGSFVFGSGTSQAAAFAAGMAVLLRDAQPSLDAGGARDVLGQTARDLAAAGKDPDTGYGLLDADGALATALGP